MGEPKKNYNAREKLKPGEAEEEECERGEKRTINDYVHSSVTAASTLPHYLSQHYEHAKMLPIFVFFFVLFVSPCLSRPAFCASLRMKILYALSRMFPALCACWRQQFLPVVHLTANQAMNDAIDRCYSHNNQTRIQNSFKVSSSSFPHFPSYFLSLPKILEVPICFSYFKTFFLRRRQKKWHKEIVNFQL